MPHGDAPGFSLAPPRNYIAAVVCGKVKDVYFISRGLDLPQIRKSLIHAAIKAAFLSSSRRDYE